MNNKPLGYETTSFTPDTLESGSRSEKLAELKRSSGTRSRRIQLLITPQMHDKLRSISEETGASVNEIINKSIESYIRNL